MNASTQFSRLLPGLVFLILCGTICFASPAFWLNAKCAAAIAVQDSDPTASGNPQTDDAAPQKQEGLNEDEPVTKDTSRWIEFKPAGAGAQVKMPRKPRLSERMMTPVEGQPPIKIKNYVLNFDDNKNTLLFSYHDLHEAPVETAIEDTWREAMLGSVLSVRGRLLTHNPIRYGTNLGCYYEFRYANNQVFFKGAARILIVGKRQYQIAALLEETKYDQELVLAFLDSFKILEEEEAKKESDSKDSSAQPGSEVQGQNANDPPSAKSNSHDSKDRS